MNEETNCSIERIIEILYCLDEDNPNNLYNIKYTDNGKEIEVEITE